MNKIFQYVFLIFIILLTGIVVSKTIDLNILPYLLEILDKRFVLLGILFIIIYMIFEVLIIDIIKSVVDKKSDKKVSFLVSSVGFYYNLVTPFASGSQPMQVYIFSKNNVNISRASAIITNKTFVFQLVVTFYCLFLIIFNLDYINSNIPSVLIFMKTSLFFNIITIFGGIFIVLSPEKMKNIIYLITKLMKRFNIFIKKYIKLDDINNFIDDYSKNVKAFIKNKKYFLLSIVFTFFQLTIYFSVSYFVYRAFNLTSLNYFESIMLQVFLYMTISVIPTPGNVGASEIAFLTIYSNIFPKEILGYAVFLYSFFVYYVILLLSGGVTIFTHYKFIKNDMKYKNRKVKI